MVKKFDLKLATMAMPILAGVLALVAGVVFYATFEPPIMTVVMPELDALNAWTAVEIALCAVAVAIAIVNYFAKKATWWRFFLIAVIALAVILEIILTVLLFRNTDLVANSVILILLSFLTIALFIAAAINTTIQFCSNRIQISQHD